MDRDGLPREERPGRGPFGQESGITAVEYALLASLIAMVIIVGVLLLGERVTNLYTTVGTHISSSS